MQVQYGGKVAGYGMSRYVPPADTVPGGWMVQTITYPCMRMISKPADKLIVADTRENGQLGGYWEFTQTNPRNYYSFDRLRHSKSANVLYCDMHVSPMTNEEVMSKVPSQTLY